MTGKVLLETGARPGSNSMKDEDIVDDIETATFSNLYKERSTAMSKFVNEIVSFIIYLRRARLKLGGGEQSVIGKDLSGKVYFVLAVHCYNVRRKNGGSCRVQYSRLER